MESLDQFSRDRDLNELKNEYLRENSEKMQDADKVDKSLQKQKLLEKKKERKRKEMPRDKSSDDSHAVVLGNADGDDGTYLPDDLAQNDSYSNSGIEKESDNESSMPMYKKLRKEVASADQKSLEEMALALLHKH